MARWALVVGLGGVLLGVVAPELRLGLLLGMGLFVLLWRSHYRDGFLWFSAFPGLLYLLTSSASWEQAWNNWFQTTSLLWIFGVMVGKMLRQERRALWPGLGLLIFYPSGLVLAVLLGLHLAWGLVWEWSKAQSIGRGFWWNPAGLVALGLCGALFVLGLGHLELRLPGPAAPIEQMRPLETPSAPTIWEAPEASRPAVRWVRPAGSPLEPWLPFLNRALDGLHLAMLLMVALVLVLTFWGNRAKGVAGRGSFLLPVLAVALTWALLLSGLRGSGLGGGWVWPGREGLPANPVAEWQDRGVPPGFTETGYLLAFLMALAGFFLLLAMLYWVWQLKQSETGDLPTQPVPNHPNSSRSALQDPIREAYRSFEERMQELGLPRPPSSSPARFAEDVTARQPQVRGALIRLLELYQRVRYGGKPLPQHGQEARRLAEEISRRFPPL
ncbi:DUF4129 domain-containing protein [Meiothermus sp.]|uniref:DUF4129 domain-containing protein n=1 Tax=Meiothermus sp. TaxID=1955249 RepID=UPI00307E3E12